MNEDAELLRRYAKEDSEEAFAELVRRHINLVYAAALRRSNGNTHLAEDVTQVVFAEMARAAPKLTHHPVLAGWLHKTTRFAVARVVRAERRRKLREQEADIMNESNLPAASVADGWSNLRPLLDEVLDELNQSDRDAVLLRFFEGWSFAEVGKRLGLAENTARMRVDRALDKMNALFARRGVKSTVAALGLALTGQAGVTVPTGLAATVSATALTGAATGISLFTLMSTTKLTLGAAALVSAIAVGTSYYQVRESRTALASAQQERDGALARLRSSEAALKEANARADAADKDNAALLTVIDRTTMANNKETKPRPITGDEVRARFQRAMELARSGKQEEALAEFLWCYDEGMVRIGSMIGVRNSFLVHELAKLAKTYPPALAALHERRNTAAQRMLASATDYEALNDYAAINRELGEQSLTLSMFEKFPEGDLRRGNLLGAGGSVYDLLLADRRYGEIAGVKSFDNMTRQLEMLTTPSPIAGRPAELVAGEQKFQHDRAVKATATDIEVLAGAGQLDRAKDLAGLLFAYDPSAETKRIVQEHLTRAGHPDLLDNP